MTCTNATAHKLQTATQSTREGSVGTKAGRWAGMPDSIYATMPRNSFSFKANGPAKKLLVPCTARRLHLACWPAVCHWHFGSILPSMLNLQHTADERSVKMGLHGCFDLLVQCRLVLWTHEALSSSSGSTASLRGKCRQDELRRGRSL